MYILIHTDVMHNTHIYMYMCIYIKEDINAERHEDRILYVYIYIYTYHNDTGVAYMVNVRTLRTLFTFAVGGP